MANNNNNTMLKTLILLMSTVIISLYFCLTVHAEVPVALLESYTTATTLGKFEILNYPLKIAEIKKLLNKADIQFKVITEDQISRGNLDSYKVIIAPIITDLPFQALEKLKNYSQSGGKLIVIFPGKLMTQGSICLARLVDVQYSALIPFTAPYSIKFNDTTDFIVQENDKNLFRADIEPVDTAKTLNSWSDTNTPALIISDYGAYVGWNLGNTNKEDLDIFTIKYLLDLLQPDTKVEPLKTTAKTRNLFLRNIDKKDDNKLLVQGVHIRYDVPAYTRKKNSANTDYNNKQILGYKVLKMIKDNKPASTQLNQQPLTQNSMQNDPTVEARAIWVDRGTIVKIQNRQQMANLFEKLKNTGINIAFFETVNAGYSIYPSRYTEQNPLTKGYDPLEWAIQEAHARQIELHPWVWVFAVGNTRHNEIIDKPLLYPGPIISRYPDIALKGKNGNMLAKNQTEFWMDPANPRARRVALHLLKEIAENYNIDGIHLDYIRYPFQSNNNYMGYNDDGSFKWWNNAQNIDSLSSSNPLRSWLKWKTQIISNFVEEASSSIREIKPNIQISAAVFPVENYNRVKIINQEWETWLENGWVDIITPMIFSTSREWMLEGIDKFTYNLKNKALIYPAIPLKHLSKSDISQQIRALKKEGFLGCTLFATVDLTPDKAAFIAQGPFRQKNAINPAKNPLVSARLILRNFISHLHSYKGNVLKDERVENTIVVAEQLYALLNNNEFKDQQLFNNASGVSKKLYDQYFQLSKAYFIIPTDNEWLSESINQVNTLLEYSQTRKKTIKLTNYQTY